MYNTRNRKRRNQRKIKFTHEQKDRKINKKISHKAKKKWSRAPFFLTGQKIARNKSADLKI